ncbi:C4-dicarboxylate ABC transporter permease [Ureibacillus massiliensis 4400831 = CIP 108448 = CCUG 49529]|uniref:C4-dicarboxylate ABC transporter permease n=2 Tax=cellular organisms TaxID=131567 RepID=A0A0A3JTN3_9BACL|nr:TRAP transporter permease [Ureibacillus massiliensis]KGR90352.1 C4-dicarboxylate ABC transporter permease [Ureibacillus massiliensis 4400831 = CIP 108448 = CCUG 49529]
MKVINESETKKALVEEISEENVQKVLEKYDTDSNVRKVNNKIIVLLIATLGIIFSLFHVYTTYNPIPTLLQRAVHLLIALAIVFLLYPTYKKQDRSKIPFYDWILFGLCILSCGYLFMEYQALMTERGGIPNTVDIIVAIVTVALVFECARRVTGWILPILALVFLIYPFFSHASWLPNMLMTRQFDLGDIFGQLYLKTEGLFSTAIGASVQYIFLFILFGAFLAKSGMGKFFNDLALALAGHQQGGPAKVAVISSAFMGSINGSAVANVVGTGAFTIPLMKKIGYDKNFAGAVESSASIGGQILPPVMGASAFIMAETTGISYGTIALGAVLPAILFFLGVIMQVHFRAGRSNLKGIPKPDLPRVKEVFKEGGHLLIPLIGLIFFLGSGVPVAFSAIYTIVLTIIVAAFKKNTRMNFKDILSALEDGARQSLSTIVACGVVGIIIGVVNLTSFGSTLTSAITHLGAGSLFLTLFLTMIASIILGMGLPSIPAYIITATMVAPTLAEFGVPILVAHMFVFYFGIFANITPPVALASFAAAGLSGGDPMRTGFASVRLALAGFIVPYLFVYEPALLLIDPTGLPMNAVDFPFASILDILVVAITSIVGVIGIGAAIEGYFATQINTVLRIILAAGALMMLIPEPITDIIGTVIVLIIFVLNFVQNRKVQKSIA